MTDLRDYWSDQARQEFDALFTADPTKETLKHKVAEAIVRGWSGNKDKPFWALAGLVTVLAQADRLSGASNPEALELVSSPTTDLWQRLRASAEAAETGKATIRPTGRGGLELVTGDGGFVLTPGRLAILRKVAEFLLVADDFAFATAFMKHLGELVAADPADGAVLRENARAFARFAYSYRQKHFVDTGAQSSFGLILRFMNEERGNELDDDCVMEFWGWPGNGRYATYPASFFAFADFRDSLRDVVERREFARAASIHDDEAGLLELADETALQDSDGSDDAIFDDDIDTAAGPELTASDAEAAISEGSLKLLKEKEQRLLRHIAEVRGFGVEFPVAALRLIAFHPVQSGISNSMRTGRSKLTLDERLTCVEAHAYGEVDHQCIALGDRLAGHLKAALAARLEAEGTDTHDDDPRLAEIQREGVVLLAKVRERKAKAEAAAANEDRSSAWRDVEPAILVAHAATSRFVAAIQRRFGVEQDVRDERLGARFAEDRQVFQQRLTERYGQSKSTSGATE